jgi:hypothetical protein
MFKRDHLCLEESDSMCKMAGASCTFLAILIDFTVTQITAPALGDYNDTD